MTLSVIVPILNEADQLPELFSALSRQVGVAFELVLVDGGSTDGSLELARKLAVEASFSCRFCSSRRGRGRQMNQGVALSSGKTLLFLHADSRFVEPHALASALAYLDDRIAATGHERIAGHFAIRFQQYDSGSALGFYFLECKARLDRTGCIHGDQGFLLQRSFFDQVGPFDESLGFLEDNRLAQAVRHNGAWLLLPSVLLTSSRRFQQEGFRQRQVLNVVIMSLEAVGRGDLLELLPGIYRQQDGTGKLQLQPFFQILTCHLANQSRLERLKFWYRTGRYAVANAWQMAFYRDVRRAFHRGLEPGGGSTPCLQFFDRFLFRLIDHPLGYGCAAVLAWTWCLAQRILG